VAGKYDHIVSIEMFEAVGEQYWTTYFDKLAELLEQGGSAVLQVITIVEDRFDEYRASPDFIQRYIFPGGMLPSKTHLTELIDKAGFELVQADWFGQSYAETLARWRTRFDQVTREVNALGFDERFLRMWRYYLDYCETGFRFGRTDVGQLLLCRR
jgi:cyclopropane-fatty-acyl-phospholipid synthase